MVLAAGGDRRPEEDRPQRKAAPVQPAQPTRTYKKAPSKKSAKMAAATSGTKPPASAPTAPAAPGQDVDTVVRQLYGYLAAFLDHPEIGPILRRAAQEGWDSARLQGAVFVTNWWKTTSESARQYEVLTSQDPAEARRRVEARALTVRVEANRLGLDLSPERINAIATDAVRMGWTDQELVRSLASELSYNPQAAPKGDVGSFSRRVKQIAADYLMNVGDEAAFGYAKRMVMGDIDENAVIGDFAEMAKGRFSYLSERIDQGITPRQFFDPYVQDIARLLEISPDAVDLTNDTRFSPILGMPDKDSIRPMTQAEAQRYVRGLPEWRKTRQAEEQVLRVANTIGQVWGKVA